MLDEFLNKAKLMKFSL